MAYIDNNFIDELKSKVNIVDVIGQVVSLKKAGSNYKGVCPFHNEKTPSFVVSETKQIFKCFGCGASGDVIKFVEMHENLTFHEAIEKIAEDNHITLPEKGNTRTVNYDKYYEINRKAALFFYNNLTKGPNPGYSYMKKREISNMTIKKFGIGFAAKEWTALHDYLKSNNVSDEDMLTLGLVSKSKDRIFDKFRNRVMFPIFSKSGKVIGFGGRVIDDTMPKYLNSSESEIFKKKNNLYALNFTKENIHDADCALIVEGYMDVISLYQSGIHNVVASLGTSLTENQGRLLCGRYTKNIVLSYDSDSAGIKAAVRGIDVIRNSGGRVKVLQVTGGKDPDEFVKKYGRDEFVKLIDKALPATDFQLNIIRQGMDLTDSMQVLEYIRSAIPLLKKLSPVEENLYIKKLSKEFGLSEQAVTNEVGTTEDKIEIKRKRTAEIREKQRKNEEISTQEKIELNFISLLISDIKYLERISDDEIEFKTSIGIKTFNIVKKMAEKETDSMNSLNVSKIYAEVEPDEEDILRKNIEGVLIGSDSDEFYKECLDSYKYSKYKAIESELINSISVAEQTENEDAVRELSNKLMYVYEAMKGIGRK